MINPFKDWSRKTFQAQWRASQAFVGIYHTGLSWRARCYVHLLFMLHPAFELNSENARTFFDRWQKSVEFAKLFAVFVALIACVFAFVVFRSTTTSLSIASGAGIVIAGIGLILGTASLSIYQKMVRKITFKSRYDRFDRLWQLIDRPKEEDDVAKALWWRLLELDLRKAPHSEVLLLLAGTEICRKALLEASLMEIQTPDAHESGVASPRRL